MLRQAISEAYIRLPHILFGYAGNLDNLKVIEKLLVSSIERCIREAEVITFNLVISPTKGQSKGNENRC